MKLGAQKAKKVLKALANDSQNFGFIKVTEEELANLKPISRAVGMAWKAQNTYAFIATTWVVIIVDKDDYLEISLIDPMNNPTVGIIL